jgi:hypothetical protein
MRKNQPINFKLQSQWAMKELAPLKGRRHHGGISRALQLNVSKYLLVSSNDT